MLGAVLCGGASRRMGVDKATVLVDAVPMARRVADVLADAGCSPVIAVGGSPQNLEVLGVAHVVDDHPGEGPLGGILTALAVSTPAVVLACDLPRLDAGTIIRLMVALEGHDAAIARTDRAEPLCAAWSAGATAQLRACFATGERAVHRAIDGLDIAWVDVDSDELRNVNTPDDLNSL
jgi:molybdopterin-guanine dinucleotide biosynthesis protein A